MNSVKIKNKLEEILVVIKYFENFGKGNKWSFSVIQKISITLDDLLNNIISYGFIDEKEHEIEIEVEVQNADLIITIKDDGIPFNPFDHDLPDTKLPIEKRKIGGLGIHFVKNLVDKYDYKRQSNKNIITLVLNNINLNKDEFRN